MSYDADMRKRQTMTVSNHDGVTETVHYSDGTSLIRNHAVNKGWGAAYGLPFPVRILVYILWYGPLLPFALLFRFLVLPYVLSAPGMRYDH